MYLIDSDCLIYFLKGDKEVVESISDLNQDKLFTSVICVGEVMEGLLGAKHTAKRSSFEKMLTTIEVVDIDLKVVKKFSELRSKLRSMGKLIDNFDLLIASSCLVYDMVLVTGDTNHFKRIPGLKIYKFT